MFDREESRNTPRSRYFSPLMDAVLLTSAALGCHYAANSSQSEAPSGSTDAAQQEFLQAFLAAHDQKDLAAQEELVNWGDVTEYSKAHFVRETLQYNVGVKFTSAKIRRYSWPEPQFRGPI